MKTKIVYSDKFLDAVGIFMTIGGITLWPFIILREKYRGKTNYWKLKAQRIINHESIHIEQQKELLVIPFYILYVLQSYHFMAKRHTTIYHSNERLITMSSTKNI